MRHVAKKLLNTTHLIGKQKYNPLANLLGFVNLANKKRKTAKSPSNGNIENNDSDSEKENVS